MGLKLAKHVECSVHGRAGLHEDPFSCWMAAETGAKINHSNQIGTSHIMQCSAYFLWSAACSSP